MPVPLRQLTRERQLVLIAVGCWVAVTAAIVGVATAAGYDPLSIGTWKRWDSNTYLRLVTEGYSLARCADDPGNWCGTAGWFPAYPSLVRLLAAPGLPVGLTGLVVSWLFALATGVLLARTFLRDLSVAAASGALLFAAFMPGAIYQHTVFPLSMLDFFSLLSIWWLGRGRWALGGLAAAIVGASYHLGVLLVPIVTIYALTVAAPSVRERLRRGAVVGGLAALGPIVTVALMWGQTGAPNAFFLLQARYHHDLGLPTGPATDALRELAISPFGLALVPSLQVLFVTLLLVAAAWQFARRRHATSVEWLLLAAAASFWFVSMAQANVGLYRTAATLAPLVPLVARFPGWLLATACACAVGLALPITVLFLQSTIV
jgi:hypothetical protein